MSEAEKPRVVITYCRQCQWLLRAAWMAQEILSTFAEEVGEVALIPATGGAFDTTHRTPSSEGNPKVSRKNLTEPAPRSGKLIRTSSEVSRTSPTVFSPWL